MLAGERLTMATAEDDRGGSSRPGPNLSFLNRGPARAVDIPRRGSDGQPPRSATADGKTLTVGQNISLTGEISSCDTLIVEGTVEATTSDIRALDVARGGTFKGKAEVDHATISGLFDGELIARERLIVANGGRVQGTMRYGRLEIEAGGELSGDVDARVKDA